ncbi:hypothetical protein EKO27_g9713 [Xylaria grammica]|uniref:Yeast cell wall synthesis Kre9/Knh1-like N-terminal domain-containing protein n=1 Tax=Xylaria grammica TaxID=363999 RepID=A0A439CTH4_9PEZI|nr:hypothetical protein EKO27_g9713 [Xylaria grammica]
MRFTIIFSSALAFAISAFAQVLEPTPWYAYVYFPYEDEVVGAGTTYTIAWDASELVGPATLFLLGGNDPATLHLWSTIASVDVNDAKYKWDVDCSFGEEEIYVIKIASDLDNGETFGLSPPFHIKGPNCHSTYSQGPSN